MEGRVHSFETMGTVDGPGIRFLVFLQGCRMKCLYCHNRDTWDQTGGKLYTPDEIIKKMMTLKHFYKASNGGITITGGEPLLQGEFVVELLKLVKKSGLTTCIDTAGNVEITDSVREAVTLTDYILFDIKSTDPKTHYNLTNSRIQMTQAFAELIKEKDVEIWLRYVLLPGYTDSEKDKISLAEYANSFKNATRIDILPYHTMGIEKWEQLGFDYQLKGVEPPSPEKVEEFKEYLRKNTKLSVY
ncbi:MAG: pyruvate formate lyase-activating protein [Spirochaetales bacterium]|nr:pyruvate formate lyase-activating protein [Spirochaetales bacterium]